MEYMVQKNLTKIKETNNFTHEVLNNAKAFRKDTFRTVQIDDKTSVVYGIRDRDGKEAIHKIMIRKGNKHGS
jgi:bifunctional DNase/RNase